MLKKISIIFVFLSISVFSTAAPDKILSADKAALHIMTEALLSLKDLKSGKDNSFADVEHLIRYNLLPNVNLTESTHQTLKKHWSNLNVNQKILLENYITESLVRDYSGILDAYNNLDNIKIEVDPKVKRKDNKAIVKLKIYINGNNAKPITVSLKMILSNDWRIYDVVFSGVSLIKNYRASFNSHIKRKGIEGLMVKAAKKFKKHNPATCPVDIAYKLKQLATN